MEKPLKQQRRLGLSTIEQLRSLGVGGESSTVELIRGTNPKLQAVVC